MGNKPHNKKVLVAMSGGIDSSVAALLLLQQGFEVIGVTMLSFDYSKIDCILSEGNCCSLDSLNDAKLFCKEIGIEHYMEDIVSDFKKHVIDDFINEYLNGRTPNPCVLCNSKVRWAKLTEKANLLNCDFIATGHYAKIVNTNARYAIHKGIDNIKDQSYFLWGVSQDVLSKIIFPLGNLTKDQVKEIAQNNGFKKLAQKKESMDVCFIPDNDYRRFLKNNVKDFETHIKEGHFLSTQGKVLGKHKGFPFYTIGQRKGLEIALGKPMYVTEINPIENTVILGTTEELNTSTVIINNINLFRYETIPDGIEVQTKIRYKTKASDSKLYNIDKNTIKIEFEQPVSAVTPGQSAVFYINNEIIGGGIIIK